MYMIILVFLIACLLGKIRQENIINQVPFAVLCSMLSIYIIVLLGGFNYCEYIVLIGIVIVLVVNCIWRKGAVIHYFTIELLLWLGIGILVVFLFSNHQVIGGDDYNYYAIFPKTIFFQGGLPDWITITYPRYASYSPIVGIFFAWIEKCQGVFDESYFFITNIWLMYTFLIPFIIKKERNFGWQIYKYVAMLIFPFVLQIRWTKMLNVDTLVSYIFFYCIYSVTDNQKKDLYYYIRLGISLIVLVLSKTPAIFFVAVVLFIFIQQEKKSRNMNYKSIFCISGAVLAFYLSWLCYCYLKGMKDYLSEETVGSGISFLDGTLQFPVYTIETVINYMKALVIQPLNESNYGLTTIFVIGITILFIIWGGKKRVTSDTTRSTVLILLVGFVIYAICHLYMYLFVFKDYEAECLSAFPRYVGMYVNCILGYILYVYLSNMSEVRYRAVLNGCILIFMVYGINYKEISFINYTEKCAESLEQNAVMEHLMEQKPDWHYGDRVIVYGDTEVSNNSRMAYYMVPFPCIIINESSISRDKNLLDEYGANYFFDISDGRFYTAGE